MAWIEFMIASQSNPAIHPHMRATSVRFVANIRYAVKGLVPNAEIDEVADGIAATVDGLFANCRGLRQGRFRRGAPHVLPLHVSADTADLNRNR
jgi:hypothetical protein